MSCTTSVSLPELKVFISSPGCFPVLVIAELAHSPSPPTFDCAWNGELGNLPILRRARSCRPRFGAMFSYRQGRPVLDLGIDPFTWERCSPSKYLPLAESGKRCSSPSTTRAAVCPFGWPLGHDPHRYLKDVMDRLSTQPASRLVELLPHRWRPPAANEYTMHVDSNTELALRTRTKRHFRT
jgi:hypothetical protein